MSTYEVSRELFGTATGLAGLRRAVEEIWRLNPASYYSLALPASRRAVLEVSRLSALADELDAHAAAVYTRRAPSREFSDIVGDITGVVDLVRELRARLREMLEDMEAPARSVTISPRYASTLDISSPRVQPFSIRVGELFSEIDTLIPRIAGTSEVEGSTEVDVLYSTPTGMHYAREVVSQAGSTRGLLQLRGPDVVATDDSVRYMRATRTQKNMSAGIIGDFESASSLITAKEIADSTGGRVVRSVLRTGTLAISEGRVEGVPLGSVVAVRGYGTYLVGEEGALTEYMTLTPSDELPAEAMCVVSSEVVRVRGDVEIVGEERTPISYGTDATLEPGDVITSTDGVAVAVRAGFGVTLSSGLRGGAGEAEYGIVPRIKEASALDVFNYAWPEQVRDIHEARAASDGARLLREWAAGVTSTLSSIAPAGQERKREAEAAEILERHARAGYDRASYLLSNASIREYRNLPEDEATFSGAIRRIARDISIRVQQ
ncbi:MAG: hypothetical protein ACO32I_01295 [Candidatus Limnocylindrus sp.]